jgi:hypothetical protein
MDERSVIFLDSINIFGYVTLGIYFTASGMDERSVIFLDSINIFGYVTLGIYFTASGMDERSVIFLDSTNIFGYVMQEYILRRAVWMRGRLFFWTL